MKSRSNTNYENKLVAIVVTDKGHVENKTINLEKSVEAREVSKTSELLNKMLKGTPINDVSAKLEFEIKPIIGNYVKTMRFSIMLSMRH